MVSISEDRQQRLNPGMAIKVPCKVASTGVLILNGEQTIDGVACVSGDRVLVKNQASSIDNGIYIVSTGGWTRAQDFDGVYDATRGTLVIVNQGSSLGRFYRLTTADSPVVFGTSAITFQLSTEVPVSLDSFPQIVDTIAALKALANPGGVSSPTWLVRGYYAVGDGGGGFFRWNSADATADNGGTVIAPNAGTGRWNRLYDPSGPLSDLWFGSKVDGVTDDAATLQATITFAAGRPVYCPSKATKRRIATMLTYIPAPPVTFLQGLQIFGDGELLTVFDNQVANNPMLKLDTTTTAKFQQGVRLANFGIVTTTAPANSIGIQIRRSFQVDLEHIDINGMSSDGVRFEINEGDGDGSVNVSMRQCHITTCAGWGVNANIAAGLNEFSFLSIEQSRIETCGTASAVTPPPSGGMKWRGQILNLRDGGFVTNENVGLYVAGGAGLGNTLTVDRWAFENNKKKHCRIEGIDNFAFRNIQLFSNDNFIATKGIEFDGSASTIRNGIIDGVEVRATAANNAYTAFTTTGAFCEEKNIQVKRVSWADFDHPGQVRYSGNMIRQEILAWVPALGFATPGDQNIVYSSQVGWYTRDEDGWIDLFWNITTSTFTHTTSVGVLQLTGMPFTSENTANNFAIGNVEWQGITKANYTHVIPRLGPNATTIFFQICGSGQVMADLSQGDMPTGGTVILRGHMRYRTI